MVIRVDFLKVAVRDLTAVRAGVNAKELGRQKINNNNSTWAPRNARNHFAASMQAVAYRPRYGMTRSGQRMPLPHGAR
jgi:hypothetical protein